MKFLIILTFYFLYLNTVQGNSRNSDFGLTAAIQLQECMKNNCDELNDSFIMSLTPREKKLYEDCQKCLENQKHERDSKDLAIYNDCFKENNCITQKYELTKTYLKKLGCLIENCEYNLVTTAKYFDSYFF